MAGVPPPPPSNPPPPPIMTSAGESCGSKASIMSSSCPPSSSSSSTAVIKYDSPNFHGENNRIVEEPSNFFGENVIFSTSGCSSSSFNNNNIGAIDQNLTSTAIDISIDITHSTSTSNIAAQHTSTSTSRLVLADSDGGTNPESIAFVPSLEEKTTYGISQGIWNHSTTSGSSCAETNDINGIFASTSCSDHNHNGVFPPESNPYTVILFSCLLPPQFCLAVCAFGPQSDFLLLNFHFRLPNFLRQDPISR